MGARYCGLVHRNQPPATSASTMAMPTIFLTTEKIDDHGANAKAHEGERVSRNLCRNFALLGVLRLVPVERGHFKFS